MQFLTIFQGSFAFFPALGLCNCNPCKLSQLRNKQILMWNTCTGIVPPQILGTDQGTEFRVVHMYMD